MAASVHTKGGQGMFQQVAQADGQPAYTPEDKARLQSVWKPRTNIEGYSALSPEDKAKVNAIKQDNAATMREKMKQEGD
jgi:hypothetical protein